MTDTRLENDELMRALNAKLPEDIVIRAIADTEPEFDVRRQAVRRHYRYVVDNRPVRPALDRGRAWHVSQSLDCDAMAAAAGSIVGRHDFRAFAGPLEKPDASGVRELSCFEVRREGHRVLFDAVANAFLPHQVRRMVGALVQVGQGRMSRESYRELLDGPPSSAGPTAPPEGLYLMAVEYAQPLFNESKLASKQLV
jgi:tRNA pseudouridine38-40 synthase